MYRTDPHRPRRLGPPHAVALVAAGVFATGFGAEPARADGGPDTERPPHPCTDASDECTGTVEVPLDWDDPDAGTIEVGFTYRPASGDGEARGTVMANTGGPGPQEGAAEQLTEALGPVLEEQNLLIVDLRGMGRSTPLDCGPFDDTDPDSVAACDERVAGEAPFFTTAQAVHDHDAVRSALGLDGAALFGTSYGTLLMQAYAAHYPDRTEAVLLDSPIAVTDQGYGAELGELTSLPARNRILAALCDDSPDCTELPGDPVGRLDRVLTELRAEDDAAAARALSSTLLNAVSEPDVGQEVNAALAARLDGDREPLDRLLSERAVPELPDGGTGTPAAYASYVCGDARYPFDPGADRAERRAQLERHYAQERPFAPFATEETIGRWSGFDQAEICASWTAGDGPPVDAQAPPTSAPALVVSGALDSTTPLAWAEATADRFPGARLAVLPYRDHGTWFPDGSGQPSCPTRLVRAFLADPQAPAETGGCGDAPFRAQGAFPQHLSDLGGIDADGLTGDQEEAVHAAFAAAADAALRRHPDGRSPVPGPESAGVRGGALRFDDEAGTVLLDGARHVADAAATGQVTPAPDGGVEARIRLDTGTGGTGGSHRVSLSWSRAAAADPVQVAGEIDGTPFTAAIPAP